MSMTPAEIEALVDARLNAKIQSLLQVLGGKPPKTEWVDASQASEVLGIPQKALYKAVESGLLRLSDSQHEREVRDRRLPGRNKPRYQFQLSNCQKRLLENPLKRH